MNKWDDYIRRYYSLPQEEQRREWAKLTAEQQAQFREAYAATASVPDGVSPMNSRAARKRILLGCFVAFVVGAVVLIGLAVIGALMGELNSGTDSRSSSIERSVGTGPAAQAKPPADAASRRTTRIRLTNREFRSAFEAGAPCDELFDIREEVAPKDPSVAEMNEVLASIGCLSRNSTRQVSRAGGTDLYSINYRSSYMVCSGGPEKTFKQAGTRSPEKASEWISGGVKAGEAYRGAYDGCLDALNQKPSRYEE